MDPFEVRMQFLDLLRNLKATLASIQKLVAYAIKHFPGCGEDIWDCIMEETRKGSMNARINVLYFLDVLCESCLVLKAHHASERSERRREINASGLYAVFITRDLKELIENIVPMGPQGLPNLISTRQILETWRTKSYIEPRVVEQVIQVLDARPRIPDPEPSTTTTSTSDEKQPLPNKDVRTMSRREKKDLQAREHQEMAALRDRIEHDRERHKRLRERRWVQPIQYGPNVQIQPLASFSRLTFYGGGGPGGGGQATDPLDVEFEYDCGNTSDWNEDDEDAIAEEARLAFPADYAKR